MKTDKILNINITAIVQAKDSHGGEVNNAYQQLKNSVEPAFLTELLAYTNGNKTHAARIAGIDRGTLAIKLKQHGIKEVQA